MESGGAAMAFLLWDKKIKIFLWQKPHKYTMSLTLAKRCEFVTYEEHALESESNARAAAYVAMKDKSGSVYWGVGVHNDIIYASLNALMSAINRAFTKR